MPFIRPVHPNRDLHSTRLTGNLPTRVGRAETEEGSYLDIKVVPGARREQIAGLLGTRLKVRVSAPPEGGKANKAVCRLIARALGIKASSVTVVKGASCAEKTLRVDGVTERVIRDRLGVSQKEES